MYNIEAIVNCNTLNMMMSTYYGVRVRTRLKTFREYRNVRHTFMDVCVKNLENEQAAQFPTLLKYFPPS